MKNISILQRTSFILKILYEFFKILPVLNEKFLQSLKMK